MFCLPARGRVWAVSAAAGVYFCDPRASPARCLRCPPQTRNAGTARGIFSSPPRGRPHAHSDGCPHDPGRVPKDLNESARISERRGHFKAIIPKYLSEPNLRPETNHAPTCRRQPAPRPCRPPPTLDGDRSAVQPRRVRGPITCTKQDQKRLDGYVLYYGF